MADTGDNRPLRVCFIAPKAYPLFDPAVKAVFGGAEVDLYMLATELAKDWAFEVSFITADYGQPECRTIEGVNIIRSLDLKKNVLSGAWRLWRAMKKADADIYMLKTASPGVPLVTLFCKANAKNMVYRTAHTRECDGTYLKDHPVLGRAFAWSLKQAKAVFAQNSTDRRQLLETIGVDATVIANGHRLAESIDGDRSSILWVARSAAVKRPGVFIDLAEKHPEEQFVMICQPATGDKNFDQLVSRARSVPNLEFHQRVPFSEIDAYFQRAKVFVNTSDSEGFPNTFIQACKAATCILSLNVNPDNFLTRYFCGLGCSGSLQSLEKGLEFMLAHDRYKELGQNGLGYVRDFHDIAKIIPQYKEYFSQLVSR
jgi:glycosyltransferase involved in cell wall biosynthesis